MSNQEPTVQGAIITWWEEPKPLPKKVKKPRKLPPPLKLSRGMRDELDVFNDGDPVWEEATFGLLGK